MARRTGPLRLLDYQEEALQNFKDWFVSEDRRALIALMVGMGKTITASSCARHVLDLSPDRRVLWITHRFELIEQSAEELTEITGIPCEIEQATLRATTDARIIVGSVDTLTGRRLEAFAAWFKPDLIVFDEAHHSLARTWNDIALAFPNAKVLNLTATPYRIDISNRLDLGRVLIERNMADGIRCGRLVKARAVGSLRIDLGTVDVRLGDFEIGGLSALMCDPRLIDAGADLIAKHFDGRKFLVFCATVEHSQILAEALRGLGLRVGEIYGSTPKAERKAMLAAVERGDLDGITNNMVLTEGLDCPFIDAIAIYRPTKNAGLYIQCLGRGVRARSGKTECLLIDALDVSKKSTSNKDFFLPTEDDRRRISAALGRQLPMALVFLSWFYKRTEIRHFHEGRVMLDQMSRLSSSMKVARAFFPGMGDDGRGSRKQVDLAARLRPLFENPPTDLDGYKTLLDSTATGNPEGFVHGLGERGWVYCPNQVIPPPGKSWGIGDGPGMIDFSVLLEDYPVLQNFIEDIVGGEGTIEEQAKKYYRMVAIENVDTVWYRAIDFTGDERFDFYFVQGENYDYYHVLTTAGDFFEAVFSRGVLQYFRPRATRLTDVPGFARNTNWVRAPAKPKQIALLSKILKMPVEKLQEHEVSRLSASAIIANDVSRKSLLVIHHQLAAFRN